MAQASFVDNLAHTNPSLLPQDDYLYHEAQYYENKKETTNLNRFDRWYMDDSMKETGQSLRAKRQKVLEDGDPSHMERKLGGDTPAMMTVDSSFGE